MTPKPFWTVPASMSWHEFDRDRYTILALDLKVDDTVTATIYAVDRIERGISLQADIIELGQGGREIPVVQFDLAQPGVEEFIRHAFTRISVRLVTQTVRDQVLLVTESRAPA